jgi:hypothetical protein
VETPLHLEWFAGGEPIGPRSGATAEERFAFGEDNRHSPFGEYNRGRHSRKTATRNDRGER